MERPDSPVVDKTHLENQLAAKKAAYTEAMRKGAIFNELKKMFLEIKQLQNELQTHHTIHAFQHAEITSAL